MKNSRILVRIFSMLLVVLTICTVFTTTAFAATSSSGKSTRTITVSTKANWLIPGSESITLSQTKGVRSEKKPFTGKVKTKNCYGEWDIVAKSTDGKHTAKATLKGSSVKINLKPNKTYKITVTWDSQADIFDSLDHGNFTKLPTWKVKSTYKVSSCY